MEQLNAQTAAEAAAAGRSRLYQLLAMIFAFPDEELYAALHDGALPGAIAAARRDLPYALEGGEALGPQGLGDSYVTFEAEYIRLFDVGAAGPPCPLYGGTYIGDRMKVMEDALRFYHFFELRLSPEMRELPDHITTQLEFLHYLTFREAQARQQGQDPTPLLRAERDFLERHLCKWVPRLQVKLAKQQTLAFYPALVDFARRFFDADHAYAAAACRNPA